MYSSLPERSSSSTLGFRIEQLTCVRFMIYHARKIMARQKKMTESKPEAIGTSIDQSIRGWADITGYVYRPSLLMQ
jgi:hypothetical protein